MNQVDPKVMLDLLKRLEQRDADCRVERVERILVEAALQNDRSACEGRPESLALLNEAHDVFINGHFIATLLLALASIEHTMEEELKKLGYETERFTFYDAYEIFLNKNIFPIDWLHQAKALSGRRNGFAHLKPADDKNSLGKRIYEEKSHPQTILEQDAENSIDLMYKFFQATLISAD